MIEHIFIKNYKAFERENIPLDKHTLLIGSYDSGKTTVLEALDLFFNDGLNRDYIRNRSEAIVIELHIEEKRYRKVYQPPDYHLDYSQCIGTLFDINHLQYLHVPKRIDNAKLLNDILSINLSHSLTAQDQSNMYKVFDYIDGILGNSNYPLFEHRVVARMNINDDLHFTKEDYGKILSNITHAHLVLGIDNVEENFDLDTLHDITKYTYQTIYTTNHEQVVQQHDYSISALYKGNQSDDFDTIKKQLRSNHRTVYVLVEGKYDVNWFEQAIRLLGREKEFTVIPCGGFGNITFVKNQLEKEGYKTVVITDGDTGGTHALSKDVIELYADPAYVNTTFGTHFTELPKHKSAFFRRINQKDDVVKNLLSRWAKKNLTKDHPFVAEVARHLKQA